MLAAEIGETPLARFAVDVNVGRLAKWLRVMGYDSLFIPDVDDGELLRVARDQGRTVLTRDRYILERRIVTTGQVTVILITSDDFREQIRQIAQTMELDLQNGFSLCIVCNKRLMTVPREQVRDRVPSFVFDTQRQFHECPQCGKLYWRGTHWRNMRSELEGFLKGV